MRNRLYIFGLIVFLAACQKQKAQLKRIDGRWKVELVRVLDGEGFTFYDSVPVGEIVISSDLKKMDGRIDLDYSYFGLNQIQDSFVVHSTNFDINESGDHLYVKRLTDTIDVRILLSSKKDLEFEYYDKKQYRLRRFALHKL
jgi:hypothetical protein